MCSLGMGLLCIGIVRGRVCRLELAEASESTRFMAVALKPSRETETRITSTSTDMQSPYWTLHIVYVAINKQLTLGNQCLYAPPSTVSVQRPHRPEEEAAVHTYRVDVRRMAHNGADLFRRSALLRLCAQATCLTCCNSVRTRRSARLARTTISKCESTDCLLSHAISESCSSVLVVCRFLCNS